MNKFSELKVLLERTAETISPDVERRIQAKDVIRRRLAQEKERAKRTLKSLDKTN